MEQLPWVLYWDRHEMAKKVQTVPPMLPWCHQTRCEHHRHRSPQLLMPPNTSQNVCGSLGDMTLAWAYGIESRQATVVLPCLQASFEDLRALTGGSRPPILWLHSDKAREFLSPVIRTYLSQQRVRQTMNSGYGPQGNGLAEHWIGIIKVRATALLADVRPPAEYWSYVCRWVAYVHTHRVTEIAINKTLPHFGDVVVVRQAFKKPPPFWKPWCHRCLSWTW